MSLGLSLARIATEDISNSLVVLEPQARSLDKPRTHQKGRPILASRMSAYKRVQEMSSSAWDYMWRARMKSATNNTQASGYVRA